MLNKSLRTLICDKLDKGEYSAGRDTIFVSFCSHFGVKLKRIYNDACETLDKQKRYHKHNAAPYCWGPVFKIEHSFEQSSHWYDFNIKINTLFGYFTEVVEVFANVDSKQGYDWQTFEKNNVFIPDMLDTEEFLNFKNYCEKKELYYDDPFIGNVGRLKRGKRTLVYLDFQEVTFAKIFAREYEITKVGKGKGYTALSR